MPLALLYRFTDGVVVRVEEYPDPHEALTAADLEDGSSREATLPGADLLQERIAAAFTRPRVR